MKNREIVNERIRREIVGPGSDIFLCKNDFSDEIIDGKPLQRYFSGILFPKEKQEDGADTGHDIYSEDNEVTENQERAIDIPIKDENSEEDIDVEQDDNSEESTTPKYRSNAFYPSHFGLSFCIEKSCKSVDVMVSFGNYLKANYSDVSLPYEGNDAYFLEKYGFNQFIAYDENTKSLKLQRELKLIKDGQRTIDYQNLLASLKSLTIEFPNHVIKQYIQKLLFGYKYRRVHNEVKIPIMIEKVLSSVDNHLELIVSRFGVDTGQWHKDLVDNIVLHVYIHGPKSEKYFVRAVLENKYPHRKDQFSLSKEKLNAISLFQTEIKVVSNQLLPFRDYHPHLYKSAEDKMLDYLFRHKLVFGIGHSTSCTWEYCEYDDKKPTWIKTTFLPEYNVRSQSTQTSKIPSNVLNIKNLSSFGVGINKEQILDNLKVVAKAYSKWIEDQEHKFANDTLGSQNIGKCKNILSRMNRGIQLLSENEDAFNSFQFANAAIYLQMFQNEWHFAKKKDGYEVFEREENLQHDYDSYTKTDFPNMKAQPSWRPFQLAFILQCIPSFVDENSGDRELVDLLYFPTGGGKTEAYLAVAAFLIFWRRLKYPSGYDGVNVIIRYTLRLLSAQQFERATKLILASEFIRQHHKELGDKEISIGFWIGDATIPNRIKAAKDKFNRLLERLNRPNIDSRKVINPFQLTNCQWCNTKLISRIKSDDRFNSIGHRVNEHLESHCLNPKCHFNEKHGGYPIVLVDDDIYYKPPTILFGTVDKFAQLAWNAEATNLFNYNGNRKPELIIQDELHLLNGPLGSLVGLFENAILALCSTAVQKPKLIASTATIKNVDEQIKGLYGRKAIVFPQYASNPDDSFFSQTLLDSKRRYLGILPTGKTTVMTNLQLVATLLYARLEVWAQSIDKQNADQFWTLLSYFKSLKELGRFSNKITSELRPVIQQLQMRYLQNIEPLYFNYWKLHYRNLELTSRIPNERIKRNLDKLEVTFDGNLKSHKAYDLVLATNMISVGLDIGRLGIMIMNGMPLNTAEYIQTSSRVARKNEGLVVTLFDPFNTRDVSYFEDFIQFHKTFYKQVEPLSVTPFAENALEKMLFTVMVTFFRHKMGQAANDMAGLIVQDQLRSELQQKFSEIFKAHPFARQDIVLIMAKIENLIQNWRYKAESKQNLKYFWPHHSDSLMKPVQERTNDTDILVAMQSMRNVEPNAEILIKPN